MQSANPLAEEVEGTSAPRELWRLCIPGKAVTVKQDLHSMLLPCDRGLFSFSSP
jgi:hypothetical protein